MAECPKAGRRPHHHCRAPVHVHLSPLPTTTAHSGILLFQAKPLPAPEQSLKVEEFTFTNKRCRAHGAAPAAHLAPQTSACMAVNEVALVLRVK